VQWGPGSASDGLAFGEDDDDEPSLPDSTAQANSLNNRVGGGAGKRLSLQELQASSSLPLPPCHDSDERLPILSGSPAVLYILPNALSLVGPYTTSV
jgi:hypothetical protein